MNPWDFPTLSVLLLRPFSVLYGGAMRVRNLCFDRGWFRSVSVPAPVVSVGNLTVGGTGKTPLVGARARFFLGEGRRPAIVGRGYGRIGRGEVAVSDGSTVLADATHGGDEPVLLALRLPGVPVLVGVDRAAVSRRAIRDFGCDLILLDDGFQHRRLRRDVDIVTLRRNEPFGNGRILPAGPLREPKDGLRRAHVAVLTGTGSKPPDIPCPFILEAEYRPVHWTEHPSGAKHPPESLAHRFVFAFSGIGNPRSFERTLEGLDAKLVGHRVFADHHRYTTEDLRQVAGLAASHGAVAVVTTEKDAMRIGGSWTGEVPLYDLAIRLEIEGGAENLRRVFGPLLMERRNGQPGGSAPESIRSRETE
jgi:tetraacyldisaccharide 4'-kinase